MWIVCDTNVWYDVALGKLKLDDNNTYVIPITVVEELILTPKLNFEPEFVKAAIRATMKKGEMSKNKIISYVEPFEYFVTIESNGIYTPKTNRTKAFLHYSEAYANDELTEKELKSLQEYGYKRKSLFKNFADLINENADMVKTKIRDKSKHKFLDDTIQNREMISSWVEHITGHKLSINFNWGMVELFMNVLGVFFLNIEIGKNRMTKNDVIDLLNLIYVLPDHFYWTQEKKWLRLINQAGMGKYIYTTN